MTHLPITHMTLYKHGVGYYQRRGPVTGESLKLTFRREEMDDLLKSLTVIDHSVGQVRGVDYDTPQSQAERLAGCSISLDDRRSLRDLLMALRGRAVQLLLSDGGRESGLLVGLDEEDEESPLEKSLVALLREGSAVVIALPLSRIEGVEVRDETAAGDLRFFLQTALGQESHRSITIRLSPGEHDLEVSYIAPAPTWRVSYRLVADDPAAESPRALLQGWGIFDNRLEEDLTDISLSLTAGMPISFIYDLYTPHTPARPVVEDEDRVAAAPVMFEAAVAEAAPGEYYGRAAAPAPAPMMQRSAAPKRATAEAMAASVESAATGQALGELFQYTVQTPVSVGRGQSALVPIVSTTLGFKKDLIYNGAKMPTHPVATLRFDNSTGLTLERGPVTVLEQGEYVGEAVLPFTPDQAEAVISYAVELGVHVKEEIQIATELQSLELKAGYLLQHVYNIRQTTYSLDNRTGQAKTVLIEHTRRGSYSPFDTPEPAEKTLETARYKVEATPRQMTKFVVKERFLQARREELRNLSYKGLQQYFADKLLDRAAYDDLKTLLDTWVEINRLEQAIKQAEQRRAKIYEAQTQTQKNMQVLATSGEEGRLRGQYVQRLAQSEEELAAIAQSIAQTQAEIERKQQDVERMIAALG
ncbi:MAG: hypothetical protein KDF65_11450 [Anaerolineae bacterium]|nr:hypothetical protein [Anaerolineae bacterium]